MISVLYADDATLAEAIEKAVKTAGRVLHSLEPVAGGRNNRAFRARTPAETLFVKVYYREPGDSRDRMASELAFTAHARKTAPGFVPAIVSADDQAGIALFEYVEGRRLRAEELSAAAVDEAVAFIAACNTRPPGARAGRRVPPVGAGLPDAAEACFSVRAHVETVDRRVARLAAIRPHDPVDREAALLAARRIRPAWDVIRERVVHGRRTFDRPLARHRCCVSPSDFGFHNAILQPGPAADRLRTARAPRLVFHDFEYAGIDDPAKLVCDFRCQPEIAVPLRHAERFARGISDTLSLDADDRARIEALLPVYRIKWCCIMMAEFLPDGRKRRLFASGRVPTIEEKRARLAGAERMLAAAGAEI